MTPKAVVLREEARRDIEEAVSYYAREAGEQVTLRFIDELETAFRAIANTPAIGSPRYAYELDLPGLRTRALKRYPYLIFYVERDAHIDVWRVLHTRRDVPAWLHETGNA
jgi:toxin ParE1/3/4